MLFECDYKFSICFENEWFSGITEKLDCGFLARTIPIYWGNPNVCQLYNEKSFINCHRFDSFDDVIRFVEHVDRDDDLYMKMLTENPFLEPRSAQFYYDKLSAFLKNMIEMSKCRAFSRSNNGISSQISDARAAGFEELYERRKWIDSNRDCYDWHIMPRI